MQSFTFFLLDGLAAMPSFTIKDFAGPEEALEYAHDLLALTTYGGVEVRLDDQQIGVVQRHAQS